MKGKIVVGNTVEFYLDIERVQGVVVKATEAICDVYSETHGLVKDIPNGDITVIRTVTPNPDFHYWKEACALCEQLIDKDIQSKFMEYVNEKQLNDAERKLFRYMLTQAFDKEIMYALLKGG